jgi:predicted DNA-binding WGR domain protein
MLVPHPDWEPDMKGATDQHLDHPTVQLQRVRPEKNERRFYAMTAALDLFGEAILIRNWGRIGTGGRLRRDLCTDLNAAGEALNDLARQKRQRGYVEFSP